MRRRVELSVWTAERGYGFFGSAGLAVGVAGVAVGAALCGWPAAGGVVVVGRGASTGAAGVVVVDGCAAGVCAPAGCPLWGCAPGVVEEDGGVAGAVVFGGGAGARVPLMTEPEPCCPTIVSAIAPSMNTAPRTVVALDSTVAP